MKLLYEASAATVHEPNVHYVSTPPGFGTLHSLDSAGVQRETEDCKCLHAFALDCR